MVNEGTQTRRSAFTNEVGEYVFAALPAATYTLRAELAGFAVYESLGIEVGVQEFFVMDITMQIAGVEETITVRGETPLIETANASVGTTLDDTELEVLPTADRPPICRPTAPQAETAAADGSRELQATGAGAGGRRRPIRTACR